MHEMTSIWRKWSRRSFLQAGFAATALQKIRLTTGGLEKRRRLPRIPTLQDLAANRLTHRLRDLYSLATAQNEYGYVQAAKSLSGLTGLSLPPFACCGVPDTPWSPGFLLTCELFLNGRILLSYSPGGDTVTYQWYPHRFMRETEAAGLRFTSETFMPVKSRAVAQSIRIRNLGSRAGN